MTLDEIEAKERIPLQINQFFRKGLSNQYYKYLLRCAICKKFSEIRKPMLKFLSLYDIKILQQSAFMYIIEHEIPQSIQEINLQSGNDSISGNLMDTCITG